MHCEVQSLYFLAGDEWHVVHVYYILHAWSCLRLHAHQASYSGILDKLQSRAATPHSTRQLRLQNLTPKDSQLLHRKKCIAPQIQYMQFLANMHPEPGKILTMSTSWCWDTMMKPHAGCLSDCRNTIPWILHPDSVAWYAPTPSCNCQYIGVMKVWMILSMTVKKCSGETRKSDLYSCNCPVTAHCPAMKWWHKRIDTMHGIHCCWTPLAISSSASTLHGS